MAHLKTAQQNQNGIKENNYETNQYILNERLHITSKQQYSCQPKTTPELQKIIIKRIKDEGQECDLNDIDVSKITDMSYLCNPYRDLEFIKFNGDVSMWDVSNVKNMSYMFYGCRYFNCDISNWDVSNVENMRCMLAECKKFKQDLNSWDVHNVKNMLYAFKYCPTTPMWYDRKKINSK